MTAPGIKQRARRESTSVDDARGRADTLQPDRFPHNEQLSMGTHGGALRWRRRINRGSATGGGCGGASRVASGVDDEQVTRSSGVNGALDCGVGGNVRWNFTANGDSHGV